MAILSAIYRNCAKIEIDYSPGYRLDTNASKLTEPRIFPLNDPFILSYITAIVDIVSNRFMHTKDLL